MSRSAALHRLQRPPPLSLHLEPAKDEVARVGLSLLRVLRQVEPEIEVGRPPLVRLAVKDA